MRSKPLAWAVVVASLMLAATACGNNSAGSGAGAASGYATAAGLPGGLKVGVILPETATSARWEGFDKPLLESAMRAQGLEPDIQNAQGDAQRFSALADEMLGSGVKVLVVASVNSEVGSTVEKKARAQGVPTIDYDRLNLGGSARYYVSFDNVRIGELQGQALAKALSARKGAQVIEVEGAPSDNNAALLHDGQERVLHPDYASGDLNLVRSQPIEGWDNQNGGQTFEQILTGNGQRVDGVVAANDGLASAVITVLQKYNLTGKVPVTGQDATPDSLKAILHGDQYMTVFKPIDQEADAVARLAAALAKGDTAGADKFAGATVADQAGHRAVRSVLLTPVVITKNDVKRVTDTGFVKAAEICGGDLAATCQQLGIR